MMRKAFLLLAFAFCACDGYSYNSPADVEWSRPESIQYAASLGVDITKMNKTSTGLYWQDIRVGEADSASVGDNVRVHFTGWLPDGTMFESTRDRSPVEFLIGYGIVLQGVDEGVVGMRVGGLRRLVVRPELAFGLRGDPAHGVPSNSTVVIEVERLTTPAH